MGILPEVREEEMRVNAPFLVLAVAAALSASLAASSGTEVLAKELNQQGFYFPTDKKLTDSGNWLGTYCDTYPLKNEKGQWLYHLGIDIGGTAGEPVYAVTEGCIVYAGEDSIIKGNKIIWVKHCVRGGTDFFYAVYGHVRIARAVPEGTAKNCEDSHVAAGEHIADIAPWRNNDHLHFGVNSEAPVTNKKDEVGWGRGALPSNWDCSNQNKNKGSLNWRGFVDPYFFLFNNTPCGERVIDEERTVVLQFLHCNGRTWSPYTDQVIHLGDFVFNTPMNKGFSITTGVPCMLCLLRFDVTDDQLSGKTEAILRFRFRGAECSNPLRVNGRNKVLSILNNTEADNGQFREVSIPIKSLKSGRNTIDIESQYCGAERTFDDLEISELILEFR